MNDKKFFTLNPDCILVSGALRGALYDLKSGKIFSIDQNSAKILERLENGSNLGTALENTDFGIEELLGYLSHLEILGLGKFVDNDYPRKKIEIKKPKEELNFIHLELTERCNLHCLHCYNAILSNESENEKMMLSDWGKVLREAYELGCRKVQFIGGEPFLKKRLLFELILQAKDIGYKFLEVFSNCTLVTEQDLKRLRRYDVQLAVSIYSQNEQIHNQITQKKYSWEKSIENLRKAKNLGISLRAAIVVMKQNEDTSKKTVEFLKTQLGIKNVKIDFVRPAGRGCDVDLVSETIFENQRFQKPKFPKTNVESFTKRKFGHNCFFDKTCISSTGEVYPCVMEHEVSYGNVKSHSLAEIFSTDLTRNFRGLSKDHIDVCRDCEYRYCCFDCRVRARGLSKNDNYYAKPWWCCYDPYKGKWISNAKGGDINGKKQ